MNQTVYESLKNSTPLPIWKKMRVDGDFLIISNHHLEIHFLNSTAKDIVELIGNNTIDQICELMLKMYDVERTILQQDVLNTIRYLQWKQLIQLKKIDKISH
ncbi:MAG: PqqD family protein [Planctomycetia bacterium]|nr:PqqD family protein [Planctomycetia bacterium]